MYTHILNNHCCPGRDTITFTMFSRDRDSTQATQYQLERQQITVSTTHPQATHTGESRLSFGVIRGYTTAVRIDYMNPGLSSYLRCPGNGPDLTASK